jgi:hypothetical protein
VRADAETGAAVVLSALAASPRTLLDAVRAADPSGDRAMAVVRLPGGDTNPTVLAVDADRADTVLAFGHQSPGDVSSVLRPTASGSPSSGRGALPPSLLLRPGVVEVALRVDALSSPSPLTASVTVDRPSSTPTATDGAGERAASRDVESWTELQLGELQRGAHTYRADVPAECEAGCRLVGLALRHPGADIASATADLTVVSISAGSVGGTLAPLDTGFDRPRAWRPGVPDLGAALVQLTPGRELGVSLSAPGGVPARIVHGDAPDPLPGLVGPDTSRQDGVVQAVGLNGGLLRVAADAPVAFVPGLGRSGALVDLELAIRATDRTGAGVMQVWLDHDDPSSERALTTALAERGVTITGRTAAARSQSDFAKDGAVLSLMLFVVCGGVALLVSAGAMLVAAFVGGRQRATEAASLRAVGVPRGVVRGGLLVENLAGVGVALVGGAVAAAVAAWLVLPVLPLFDQPSEFVSVSATPDLPVGGWTLLGVAAALGALAAVVASGQLRGGTVERIGEGGR